MILDVVNERRAKQGLNGVPGTVGIGIIKNSVQPRWVGMEISDVSKGMVEFRSGGKRLFVTEDNVKKFDSEALIRFFKQKKKGLNGNKL